MNTNKIVGWSAVAAAIICFAVLGSTVVAPSSSDQEIPAEYRPGAAGRPARDTEHLDAPLTLGQIVDLHPETAAFPLGANGVRPCGVSVDPLSVSSAGYSIALRNCSSITQRRAPTHLSGDVGACKDVTPYATQTWRVAETSAFLELVTC